MTTMTKLTNSIVVLVILTSSANAWSLRTVNFAVKTPSFIMKSYRVVKGLIKGPDAKLRDTLFRRRALANAKTNKSGQVQDAYSGKYMNPKDMEADHIFPLSKGGANSSWNSAMTKTATNRSKGAKIQPVTMLKGYGRNAEVQKVGGGVAAGGVAIGVAP